PDDLFHYPQANIREMKRFYQGIYPGFDTILYEKLKEIFQLDEKQPMRRLSKGMLKQAGFWLALCTHPEYLVLDEPVDGLDPVMRRQVWSLILDEAAQVGTTVLVSSHNLRELEDVCDQVGIMEHGRMLLERSLEALQDNIVKIQLVTDRDLPGDLDILHQSISGRIRTLIVRGTQQVVSEKIGATLPIFFDVVPLSLEEIFIYELGGVDYAVKNIIL
ncbi:MAG: ABC transporter ATP-binding protein, partial [Eubacteriales bacterium]